MIAGLAAENSEPKAVITDITYLRTHRTATRLDIKKGAWTPAEPVCDRKTPAKYDKRRYKRRNRIEIMFGWLKD